MQIEYNQKNTIYYQKKIVRNEIKIIQLNKELDSLWNERSDIINSVIPIETKIEKAKELVDNLKIEISTYFLLLKDFENPNKQEKIKTYLMKNNHTKLYKIGYSKNPKHREKTLQSQEPNIKMVKVWNKNIEKKLHKLYSEYRVRGEWFDLTPIQVKYICTHF